MSIPGDDLNEKAAHVLAEAAALPSTEEVRVLAAQAVAHGSAPGMSIEQIRGLAREAVDAAEQVKALLLRLTDILDAPPPPAPGGEW